MAKKRKININDMTLGVFKTGFPMLDLLTGRDHIPDIEEPDNYYKIRGLRSGTMLGAFAMPQMGKTTLMLNIAGNIVRQYSYPDVEKSNPQLHYYSAEGGADLSRICATTGIPYNNDVGKFIKLYKRKDTSTDRMFLEFKEICDEKEKNPDLYKDEVTLANNKVAERYLPTVFIIDSISALTPQQLKDKDKVDNMHAATRARINGNYIEKMRNLSSEYNIMIFLIQHESVKVDSNPYNPRVKRAHASDVVSTGGKKVEFESDVQLRLDRIIAHDKDKTNKKYKNEKGFNSIIRCVITKNRFGDTNPDMNFHLIQHKLYGFDPLHSYVYDILEKTDIISHKGGGRYKLKGWDKSFYKKDIVNLIREESKFRNLIKKEMNKEYHEFLKYHDTDDLLNKNQNLINELL